MLQELTPPRDVLVPILALEPGPNLGARTGRGDEIEPVPAGSVGGTRRQDLHAVAVVQRVIERHHHAIDLGADAPIPELGMDAVGEVDGRGFGGQVDDVALGAEDKDLVLEHVDLERIHELGAVRLQFLLPAHQGLDPAGQGGGSGLGRAFLLVEEVGGHAMFG